MELNRVFIGRQPVIGRNKKIFGYELLFRNSMASDTDTTDNIKATASVMVNALNDVGLKRLIGDKKGFISVDGEILESGIFDLLPKGNIVLAIPESVESTIDFVDFFTKLRGEGYQLSLDDFIYRETVSQVLNLVNFITIDPSMYAEQSLSDIVVRLKSYPVKLLAKKVETREDFEFCQGLGFDYFQGNFFAKPSIVTVKSFSPAQLVLMNLSRSLAREEEFNVIEGIFKKNPELNYKLLKFMNSAAFYTTAKITSIRQSLALLGYRNLQKWVTLLLFAGEGGDFRSSPLLERAALRGRIMELLAKRIKNDPAITDSAFMAGALSLSDVLLQMPISAVLDEFNLSQEINDALMNRTGFLGTLLLVIEMLEQEKFSFIKETLEEYSLTLDDLFSMEINAIVEYETTSNNEP